jgi:hypothetical protein
MIERMRAESHIGGRREKHLETDDAQTSLRTAPDRE